MSDRSSRRPSRQASAPPLPSADAAIRAHFPTAAAVAELLHPFAEVVLHDWRTNRIAGIWNAFSRRVVGDPSYLDEDVDADIESDVQGPYEKAHDDGSRLKSISATLRDPHGKRIGYLCINMDVSRFDAAIAVLEALSKTPAARPIASFKYDLREQLNLLLRDFLLAKNKTLGALSREEKIELIQQIDAGGFFDAKGGVAMIGGLLNISRTNVYHQLKAARAAKSKR